MALVRKICFVFVSFFLSVKTVVPQDLPAPEVNVTCTETGFIPLVKQQYTNNTEVLLDVKLGNGGYGCSANSNITGSDDGSDTINSMKLNGSMEISYINCQGYQMTNNNDNTSIEFQIPVEVIVTHVLRKVIKRQKKYDFNVKCVLTKDAGTVSSQGNWTIGPLQRTGNVTEKQETFTLATQLRFYKTDNYTDANLQDTEFTLGAGETLYLQISEVNSNNLFKFVVHECWSTPNPSPTYSIKDVFLTNRCEKADNTVNFNHGVDYFRLDMKAFFFSIDKQLAIYVHCRLFVCQVSDDSEDCTQCDGSRRKRRSVDNKPIERVTISSQQHILFDNSEIYAPDCAEGYVYDRKDKECTKQNILQISGVYLDIDWNPLYANTSSNAFAEFAKVKAYQLYALIQSSNSNGVIRGLKVVKAAKGSVILDVQVKYAETSNSAAAFTEFESALRTTRVTASRVLNILNIKQRQLKTVEYVSIAQTPKSNMGNLTLIVVVVVLLVAVFISGITFYKVKQLRRSPASTKDVNGFDNKAMDNMS